MAPAASEAEGYFPRGRSVLRRVHGERVVGRLYGQRALLLQACHPLAFAGLTANTHGRDAPFRRLVHTAKTMETVFFGGRAEADRETARVRTMHARVRGTIDEPAGPHPAGAAYRADDPEFLLWILACLADSAQAVYERFARRLSRPEREAFWQDYLLLGELFGLDREHAPPTYAAFRGYMAERLASDDLHLTGDARELGRTVAFDLPLPLRRQPALLAINHAVAGLLPHRVRRLYGIPWSPAHELALEALAISLRSA
ncbi:MAG TPA: oxygenase MpaB family protein, partial [Thermoleophilaceae bacterium]